jgi:hypothetical protein
MNSQTHQDQAVAWAQQVLEEMYRATTVSDEQPYRVTGWIDAQGVEVPQLTMVIQDMRISDTDDEDVVYTATYDIEGYYHYADEDQQAPLFALQYQGRVMTSAQQVLWEAMRGTWETKNALVIFSALDLLSHKIAVLEQEIESTELTELRLTYLEPLLEG